MRTIKRRRGLIKIIHFHLTHTEQDQSPGSKIQRHCSSSCMRPAPASPSWALHSRLLTGKSHILAIFWAFHPPQFQSSPIFLSRLLPWCLMLWCHNPVSVTWGNVSMVMSSDVIKEGLLQGWMKSGTRWTCLLTQEEREMMHVGTSRKWGTKSLSGWQLRMKRTERPSPRHGTLTVRFGKEQI